MKDKGVRGVKLHLFVLGFHANKTVRLDPIYADMVGHFPKINIVMVRSGFMWARKDAVEQGTRNASLNLRTACLLPMGIRDGIE